MNPTSFDKKRTRGTSKITLIRPLPKPLRQGNVVRVNEAARSITDKFGKKIVAISLFGSSARKEAGERSDIDLFIVVRDMPKGMERRRTLYDAAYQGLEGGDITIVDADQEDLFTQELEVTPLLLNIAWDSLILHDPDGKLSKLFVEIRRKVEESGLERYRTTDGKYGWKPRLPECPTG